MWQLRVFRSQELLLFPLAGVKERKEVSKARVRVKESQSELKVTINWFVSKSASHKSRYKFD